MAYHNNSVPNALINLFPNIGLDKLKLKAKSNPHSLLLHKFEKYSNNF